MQNSSKSTTAALPEVSSHDNRAGENPEKISYGFVYFADGTRLAYTSFDGVVADANGGWEPTTDLHAKAAHAYLVAKGVLES